MATFPKSILQGRQPGGPILKAPGDIPLSRLDAAVDPTVTDDASKGYAHGSVWVNRALSSAYVCVDATTGDAVWVAFGFAGPVQLGSTGRVVRVRNETGVLIDSATSPLVAAVGYSDVHNAVLVEIADNRDPTKRPALGALSADLANGANGLAQSGGLLFGADTSAFSANQQLMLGEDGAFSLPRPDAPLFFGEQQPVGQVVKVDAVNGIIQLVLSGLKPDLPRGYLSGARLSDNAVSPAFKVDIAVGACRSSDNLIDMFWFSSLTADITVSGANGLDTGVEASDTWYHVFVITGATVLPASLLSISATAPTMPAGYTSFRRVGTRRNNASSDFIPSIQYGEGVSRLVFYTDAVANRQVLSAGAAGAVVTPVVCSAFVPPTTRIGGFQFRESGTAALLLYDDPASALAANTLGIVAGNELAPSAYPVSDSQEIGYAHLAGGGSADIWVTGYTEELEVTA